MDQQALVLKLNERLKIQNLPQEVQEHIVIQISDSILERTMLAITRSLSEDEAKLAHEQLAAGEGAAFMNMLSTSHPELDETVVKITEEVIAEFLEGR